MQFSTEIVDRGLTRFLAVANIKTMTLEDIFTTLRKFDIVLKQLNPKERTVFRLRTGFYITVNKSRTLEKVAAQMGGTKQRISKIEIKGAEKIRKYLDEYK